MRNLSELPLAELHALRKELKRQKKSCSDSSVKLTNQVDYRLAAVNNLISTHANLIDYDK